MTEHTLTQLLLELLKRITHLEARFGHHPHGSPSVTGAAHQNFPVYDFQGKLICEMNPKQ